MDVYQMTKMDDEIEGEIIKILRTQGLNVTWDDEAQLYHIMNPGLHRLDIILKKVLPKRNLGSWDIVGPMGIKFSQKQTQYLRNISRSQRPGALPIVIIESNENDNYYFLGKRELRAHIDHVRRGGSNNPKSENNGYRGERRPDCIIISNSFFIFPFESLDENMEKVVTYLENPTELGR